MKKVLLFILTISFSCSTLTEEVCWDVYKSDEENIDICQRLAAHGDPEAQSNLGSLYFRGGRGVIKDHEKAVELLMKSASQDWEGRIGAQDKLGMVYSDKHSPLKDYEKAIYWFKMAALEGRSGAQQSLGSLYFYKNGPHKNIVEGYMWFIIASKNGVNVRFKRLDKKVSTREKATAIQLANKWIAKHPCAMNKNYYECNVKEK